MSASGKPFATRADLASDLRSLGLRRGDSVLVHSSLTKIGPMIDGPDTLVGALLDVVSSSGTVLAHTGWNALYEVVLDVDGRVPRRWRKHIPPFDARSSRADRAHGVLPEFVRTWPGAVRSASPRASVAAIGARAEWFTADHPVNPGYGPGSPFAKLVEVGGKVAMLGAPVETMTLLRHAEHMADLEYKSVVHWEVPFATPEGVVWRLIEEFDTGAEITGRDTRSTFATIVSDFVESGGGRTGFAGDAVSFVADAAEICAFAVRWMEEDAAADDDDDDE
ncbi:aminoglycoside 3-N-acetyltransferase [Pseudonocardia endophytica]|uniref:Aminoglycoside N(3)-acetyltransferase n=1 Tax=Pseudonocardia endophytica TaxID=401976 RepID=A0A4R1HUV8_PSEEN|nr:aminoglycoside 3-N-acetyltransferase [Pseudonocardia endophytica]TCK24450.1 aminoglycoside 3-N-acetyltransferase [Pseudonocardia endophytica]